jgi:hypothetical protein
MQRGAAEKPHSRRWVLSVGEDITRRIRVIAEREERSLSWVTRALLVRALDQIEAAIEAEKGEVK